MSAGEWPKVAVVGAGAVGGYFGGLLARAGAPVIFIGRPAFADAVKQNGLFLDTVQFQERVKVAASTDLAAAHFDAAYAAICAGNVSAACDATLTILPPPFASIDRAASRVHRNADAKLMSSCTLTSFIVVSTSGFIAKPPTR